MNKLATIGFRTKMCLFLRLHYACLAVKQNISI